MSLLDNSFGEEQQIDAAKSSTKSTKRKSTTTKKTGIPTSQAGIERKMGRKIWDWVKGLFGKE